jgi:hypothetical protein
MLQSTTTAAVQLVEIYLTVNSDGTVHYEPGKEITITERLALVVFNLIPGSGVTDLSFADTPFLWIEGTDGHPRTEPSAVEITRESARVATILIVNVRESLMHVLPVLYVMFETTSGGSWKYVIPGDPTIINKDVPEPGPGKAAR